MKYALVLSLLMAPAYLVAMETRFFSTLGRNLNSDETYITTTGEVNRFKGKVRIIAEHNDNWLLLSNVLNANFLITYDKRAEMDAIDVDKLLTEQEVIIIKKAIPNAAILPSDFFKPSNSNSVDSSEASIRSVIPQRTNIVPELGEALKKNQAFIRSHNNQFADKNNKFEPKTCVIVNKTLKFRLLALAGFLSANLLVTKNEELGNYVIDIGRDLSEEEERHIKDSFGETTGILPLSFPKNLNQK